MSCEECKTLRAALAARTLECANLELTRNELVADIHRLTAERDYYKARSMPKTEDGHCGAVDGPRSAQDMFDASEAVDRRSDVQKALAPILAEYGIEAIERLMFGDSPPPRSKDDPILIEYGERFGERVPTSVAEAEAAIVAQHGAEAIEPGVPAPEPPSEISIPVVREGHASTLGGAIAEMHEQDAERINRLMNVDPVDKTE